MSESRRGRFLLRLALALSVGLSVGCGAPRPARSEEPQIEPADVFRILGQLDAEVERLRFDLGAPQHLAPSFTVADAAPREVFYQALSLLEKADELSFEQTGELGRPVVIPDRELTPGDVHAVVAGALDRILAVATHWDIAKPIAAPDRDSSKRPADVYNAILRLNGQLNLLLDQSLAPTDVYGQVETAIGYAALLLERFAGATSLPPSPPLVRGMRPADVHQRLTACLEPIREVATRLGTSTLRLESMDLSPEVVKPSDVYDVATLLVSQLSYLNKATGNGRELERERYSERKRPSDVYRRADVLRQQLDALVRFVKEQPTVIRLQKAPAS